MIQTTLDQLSGCRIHHGNSLKARMEITACNLHNGSFRSELLVFKATIVYSVAGSRRCHQIKRSAAKTLNTRSSKARREGSRQYFRLKRNFRVFYPDFPKAECTISYYKDSPRL